MTQYAKLVSNTKIEFPPKNKGNICNYNLDTELLIQDGYKEFIEVEIPITNRYFHIEYEETENTINEIVIYDETQEEANVRELEQAKQNKIQDNDTARDETLNRGVVYREVLFDSDTDQKVNLLATVSMIGDLDLITWFGMDNQPLECTKEDLINIGSLITQLHTFCWNKNAEIKQEINGALTIEEVNNIIIDYTLVGE